jgi:hypothetical protein
VRKAKAARRSKAKAKAPEQAKPSPDPKDDGKRNAETGRFLPGHQFWRARASSALFADGDALWAACDAYFCWVEDNPVVVAEQLVVADEVTKKVPVAIKTRPMTKRGLCRFLGIAHTTWAEWKRDRPELAAAIERAESVIWDQKFAGAAVGIFNGNLVARELGIADRVAGHDGGPVQVQDLTPQRPDNDRLMVLLAPFLGLSPAEATKQAKALPVPEGGNGAAEG